jgi:vacuolar-type H+-ATPase subunit E/Vma4
MALKDILSVIAADAEEEARAIRQAAEQAYRVRMQVVEDEANALRAGIVAEAQHLAEQERVRILHRVRLENLRQRLQVQQSAFLAAVCEAQGSVSGARERSDYGELLARLVGEAWGCIDKPAMVVVHPDDEQLLRAILDEQGIRPHAIETRADLAPGVMVRTLDGRIAVDNTLTSRLLRARPDLHALLADLLGADRTDGRAADELGN